MGPPGTGKTTTLLRLLEEELAAGTEPSEIAFVTFTRSGRAEAKERAAQKFNLSERQLHWFRTIHSTAYALIGGPRSRVMDYSAWKKFGLAYRYSLSDPNRQSLDDDPFAPPLITPDDLLRGCVEWGRNRRLPIEEAVKTFKSPVKLPKVVKFREDLEAFKARYGYIDYNDFVEQALLSEEKPEVKVAFVDEAQDLSPLQIAAVEHWFGACERVYVAGDEDQAIFSFQGAEPTWILGLANVAKETQILEQSYRLPQAVHEVALKLIRQNRQRIEKAYRPREGPGLVRIASDANALSEARRILDLIGPESSVYVLARNRTLLQPWSDRLDEAGIVHAAEGTRFQRGTGDASWRLSTIHGSKGREADLVIILSDMAWQSYSAYLNDERESENRVAYVGVTRARKALLVVRPMTQRHYPLERFCR